MRDYSSPSPQEIINASKKPINPHNIPGDVPNRILQEHNRDGERRPEEKKLASTYYPIKSNRPGGVA